MVPVSEINDAHEPVHFFIIGAPRSATTTLYRRLASHPQVIFSRCKEPHFFNRDSQYAKGIDFYESMFPDITVNTRAMGDASTHYSQIGIYPKTVERIHAYDANARIVYVVRHPLERLRSHVQFRRASRFISAKISLLDALRAMPDVIESGRYYKQISSYWERFPRSQTKILFFDELVNDPDLIFDDLARFLGIDENAWAHGDLGVSNAASELGADPHWFWWAKEHARAVSRLVPRSWIRTVRKVVHTELPNDVWTPDAVEFARLELQDDAAAFLSAVGRPDDYWSWTVA